MLKGIIGKFYSYILKLKGGKNKDGRNQQAHSRMDRGFQNAIR